MKKTSLGLSLLLAIFLIVLCVWGSRKISAARSAAQKAAAGPRDTAVAVRTDRVKLGSVRNILTFNGDIEAMRTVDLQSKVAGRLATLALEDGTPVEEGTRVKKGQLIATLDDREYKATLASALAGKEQRIAALLSAQASLTDKEREYNRAKNLVAQAAGTQQSLDQAETAYNQAKADLQEVEAQIAAARATIEQAQLDCDETKIYAPMDGVVSRKHLDPGVMVKDSTPLVTILEIDTVKVVLSIPVNRLSLIVPGKTQATLRSAAHPGERFPCVVEKIYPAVDSVTRTAQVELRLKNSLKPDGTYDFLPGMYATVDMLMEERNDIVTVDVSLPIRNLDRELVYVCEGDTVRAVPVTLGLTTGGQVEILEGLKAGDEIVVQGQHRLTDGATIKRVEE